MSISMYGRAQRTCGRACPHAQTHTYTRIYTHKNRNTHSYTLTYQDTLLFFLCQFDTLFESRVLYWNLIVGILWIFCLFVCCYKTRKSILHLPPWKGRKARRNPCFARLCLFPPKNWLKNCTTQRSCGTNTFPKGKTWFLRWHPTNQPLMHVTVR